MVFQVDIADPALLDAQEAFEFIRDVPSKPHAGEQWFRGLVEAIYSLEHNPERCPIVPEQLGARSGLDESGIRPS